MTALQLPGAGSPKALARIVPVPDIQVADLRARGGRETEQLAGGHAPGFAGARGDEEVLGFEQGGGGEGAEAGVEGGGRMQGGGGRGREVGWGWGNVVGHGEDGCMRDWEDWGWMGGYKDGWWMGE
tara:strand:+ start:16907 stop:17284 length:378 start_codon:yes stop_codon:yes gene_type:complete